MQDDPDFARKGISRRAPTESRKDNGGGRVSSNALRTRAVLSKAKAGSRLHFSVEKLPAIVPLSQSLHEDQNEPISRLDEQKPRTTRARAHSAKTSLTLPLTGRVAQRANARVLPLRRLS